MNNEISYLSQIYKERLSKDQFQQISNFISNEVGIKMPEEKKIMLQGRLYKRLKALNIKSFNEYCDYVFKEKGRSSEIINMIDVVCTNKTSFFRESQHFNYLQDTLLPQFVFENLSSRNINIWSAGCSSGEEVYSIAMVIDSFFEKHKKIEFSITGTDISTQILQKAVNAVYPENLANDIPGKLKIKYLLKSRDRQHPTVKIVQNIRSKTSFKRLNLMDDQYDFKHKFDIVFCRNVIIYFDRPTQEKVLNKICQYIKPGGYLFIGHSESVFSMNVPLIQLKPTIYQKI
ncbi:MAG: methyltransferase domain-containing protein [Bacteroidales bacterium]|nr:methyltransferase domain-containing protein [Bacteroidales bacterium]